MVKSELAEQVDFTKHLRNYLNKAAKEIVAYDLEGDNPTQVRTWISTGSTLLDYIIRPRLFKAAWGKHEDLNVSTARVSRRGI